MIDEDLDAALAVEAKKRRTSKAALIREYVRAQMGSQPTGIDPILSLAGTLDFEPADIDEIVYG